jgi:hypothetical protein
VALIPQRFSVTFGKLVVADVEVKPGKITTLNPGVIRVQTARIEQYDVIGPDGQLAGQVGTGKDRLALPAGEYTLALPDRKIPIDLREGQVVEFNVQ